MPVIDGSVIDTTAIIAAFGAWRDSGQSLKDIATMKMQAGVTEKYFNKRNSNVPIVEGSLAEFSKPLQRFQKYWTPKGGVDFTPGSIIAGRMKIDDQFYPDDVVDTWLQFLADTAELDRKKWPFVKWYIKGLLAKGEEQWELDEVFHGVQAAVVPGTASTAGTLIDGLKKQINVAVAATTAQVQVLGAVPTTPAGVLAYAQSFVEGIPQMERNELDYLFMSEDNASLYQKGMDAAYNTNYQRETDLYTIPYNRRISIVPLPSMHGSNKMFATPKFNRRSFVYHEKNLGNMYVESDMRLVKASTDYWRGIGFLFQDLIYTNDVELT